MMVEMGDPVQMAAPDGVQIASSFSLAPLTVPVGR